MCWRCSCRFEPAFGEAGATTVNIGLIGGGYAPNVMADKAEAHLLVRTVGPSQEVKDAIARVVAGRAEVNTTLDLACVRMRRGGRAADDGGEVCHGYSDADGVGRAVPAGAGIDPRGAHAAGEDQQERTAGVRGSISYVELATGLVGGEGLEPPTSCL